jgi:hypothetical protein
VRGQERAYPKVRERGPEPPTRAWDVRAAGGCGGEGGIRTRDGLPQTAFPVRRHSPLGDLSRGGQGNGAAPTGAPSPRPEERRQPAASASEAKAEPRTGASAPEVRERGAQAATRASGVPWRAGVAERAGFEPAVLSHTAFRERHHQPLGHLSAGEDTKGRPDGRIRVSSRNGHCQCRCDDECSEVGHKYRETDRQPRTFVRDRSLAGDEAGPRWVWRRGRLPAPVRRSGRWRRGPRPRPDGSR